MSYEKAWQESSKGIRARVPNGRRMVYAEHRVGQEQGTTQKFTTGKGGRIRFKQVGRRFNGQTAFYRHPSTMSQIIDWTKNQPQDHVKMLVVPSSIGCEPYTFAMMAKNVGLLGEVPKLSIDAFDISDEFLRVARTGVYPSETVLGLPEYLVRHFNFSADGDYVAVKPEIKEHVNFLPHCSLRKFKAIAPYDIVVAQNFLKHADGAPWDNPKEVKKAGYENKQAEAIKNLCDLTAQGGVLFADMIEETPFAFHYSNPPFNPFKDNGMVYLNADLKPYRNGRVYPRKESEVLKCIRGREYVHGFQKLGC